MPLVDVAPPMLDLDLDLRYASPDNIAGRVIYRRPRALLHPAAAHALGRAAALAAVQGLRLRLFDAFRPAEAQWVLWRACPDPAFVADPRRGSAHARGVAVDLTLVDAASGQALDMGTGFDEMGPRAHHGCLDVSPAAQRNRALLLGLMASAGWVHYPCEWWHYQLPDAARYPLLTDRAAGAGML